VDFEQAYGELQQLYSSANRVPGLRRKVMVDADQFSRVIDELRTAMPADIQEAQEIIRQKDSILNQAYLESQRVKSKIEDEVSAQKVASQREHESMVGESAILKVAEVRGEEIREEAQGEAEEVIQNAQRRAYRIITEAEDIASSRREGANQYASEVMFSLEEQLSEILGQIRRGIDTLRPESDARRPAGASNDNMHVGV
jgi:hypothetical protein